MVVAMSEVLTSIQVVIKCDAARCPEALLIGMSPEYVERYFESTDQWAPHSYTELARHTVEYNRAGWGTREELGLDFCIEHGQGEPTVKIPEVYLEPSRGPSPGLTEDEVRRMQA